MTRAAGGRVLRVRAVALQAHVHVVAHLTQRFLSVRGGGVAASARPLLLDESGVTHADAVADSDFGQLLLMTHQTAAVRDEGRGDVAAGDRAIYGHLHETHAALDDPPGPRRRVAGIAVDVGVCRPVEGLGVTQMTQTAEAGRHAGRSHSRDPHDGQTTHDEEGVPDPLEPATPAMTRPVRIVFALFG